MFEGLAPYPLSDSTNLLGPNINLAVHSACYTNYGTNIHTPVPIRKCYYDYTYSRDHVRRHSAHGRMNATSTTASGRSRTFSQLFQNCNKHLL